jgi:RHS repeat-associated protein
VSNGVYTTDIDDQDIGNYRYDKIGNLTHDDKEEIDSIHWNVYGKISKIVRKVGSKKPSLEFEYDAMGQRVLKVVKKGPIEKDWDYTWYVRDAQGNIMATYNKKNILKNGGDTSIYRKINNSIVSQYNTDSLAEFIKYFYKGTQVYSSIGGELISRELLDDYLETYHADSILYYDSAYASDVLKYFCDYVPSSTDRRDLLLQMLINKKDSIIEMIGKGCFNMNDLIARVLTYDGASDELLNALATLDISRFDLIYQSLGAPPPPPIPTLAQKITFIRSNSNLSISNSINNQFNVSELETIIKSMTSSIIDSVIMNLELCELNTNITNCSFDFTWFNFVVNSIDNNVVKSIILGTSEPNYLSNLLIDKDRYSVNKIASLEKDIFADVLRNETSVDLMVYLSYIYKRFGRTVFNQIIDDLDGDLTLNKNITLNELHIYGSSRHGIAKPDKLLASKTYEITEITEEGGFGSVGYANDSIVGQLEYAYFKRTLTKKQYELTNHLGNVLATILDRKTAVTDSLGGDTLKFYQSDVSTAQYYYAFGSCIQELQYAYSDAGDTSKYRFGFNGEESESDISGEGMIYDLGERFYDGRLGRMFSVDPLDAQYTWQSPYSYCYNTPIWIIDEKGMGGDPQKGDKVKQGEGLAAYMKRNGMNYYNKSDRDLIAKLNPDIFQNGVTKGKYMLYTGMELNVSGKPANEINAEPIIQSVETFINELNRERTYLYSLAKKSGCPNFSDSRCSTYSEQISVINEKIKWASLDVKNGQILPPVIGYWNKIINGTRTVTDPGGSVKNPDGSLTFSFGTDYFVNSDGYITSSKPRSNFFTGTPPFITPVTNISIIFKTGHIATRMAKWGLNASKIESMIYTQINKDIKGASAVGEFWGKIIIDGEVFAYRAKNLGNGTINVGTYYKLQ